MSSSKQPFQIIPEFSGENFQKAVTHGPSVRDIAAAMDALITKGPEQQLRLRATLESTIHDLLPPNYPQDMGPDSVGWLYSNRIEFDLLGCVREESFLLPLHLFARMIWPANPGVGWKMEMRYDSDLQHGRIQVIGVDVRCIN